MASSSCVLPPRLLTSSATWEPLAKRRYPRPSSCDRNVGRAGVRVQVREGRLRGRVRGPVRGG